ncbi:MAG: DUF2784 domain-containing protein [Deltaproteobacteria bacterium]|nr:DUF2784 domain-containing protein [Deltaproteobacteria bacterium]
MFYRVLADAVVVAHLAFAVFAVIGGALVLRWRRCAWIHVPAALWAVVIECMGWVCPLTPLENWFRQKAGSIGYETGFIEHYIIPVLYPTALTRGTQIALGLFVLVVNLGIYGWVACRIRKD